MLCVQVFGGFPFIMYVCDIDFILFHSSNSHCVDSKSAVDDGEGFPSVLCVLAIRFGFCVC